MSVPFIWVPVPPKPLLAKKNYEPKIPITLPALCSVQAYLNFTLVRIRRDVSNLDQIIRNVVRVKNALKKDAHFKDLSVFFKMIYL